MRENSSPKHYNSNSSTLKPLAFLATLFLFCVDSNQKRAEIVGTSCLGGIFVNNTSKKNKLLCFGLCALSFLLAYFLEDKPGISKAP